MAAWLPTDSMNHPHNVMLSKPSLCALMSLPLLLPTASCGGANAQGAEQERWTQAELEGVAETIQGQLEELRAERFERPVDVQITDQEGFLAHATERLKEFSSEEDTAAEEAAAKLLGLVPPSMDLMEVTFKVLEDQVGGFYDPGSDKFFLMESFTGALAEIIVAHELTHALDDQLYDIDGTLTELLENRDALSAYQAVVEGSGTAMMQKWMMKFGKPLSAEEMGKAASMGTESLGVAPAYVWKPLLASYTAGQAFLNRGYRLKKKQGLSFSDVTRIAFQSSPRSTEQVLHPSKYWKEEDLDEPIPVHIEVELPGGWEVLDRTTLGELVLALVTDEAKPLDFTNPMAVLSIKYTNEAAEGWGGDSMLLLGRDDARFLHVATVWDSAEDASEFRTALEKRLETWRADVAQLGQGGSVQLLPAKEGAPKQVRFSAWFGLDAEELGQVSAGLSVK